MHKGRVLFTACMAKWLAQRHTAGRSPVREDEDNIVVAEHDGGVADYRSSVTQHRRMLTHDAGGVGKAANDQ